MTSHLITKNVPTGVMLIALALGISAQAGDNFDRDYNQGPSFTIIEENDLFMDTDRHYTQGIRLSYLTGDKRIAEQNPDGEQFLERSGRSLLAWGYDPKSYRIGYEVGQNMYTPRDISIPGNQPNDRPYAGWLYFGLNLQRRGETTQGGTPTMENLSLLAGIIGPWSVAKEAQIWVHELRGFDLPQGWHHQLKNEPAIALRYQRFWLYRFGPRYKFNLDIIPDVGFSAGNPLTAAQIGGTIRAGWNIPDDFGVQHGDALSIVAGGPSPTRESHWGAYVYAGAAGRAVAYNTFIDGNMFRNGPGVTREPLVADLRIGVVATSKYLEAGLSLIHRTHEFKAQTERDAFGSVYLRVKW
ncbi:MAG: lipid A deacylase LpxR family protein [Verrucomicrobiota bacterium]